MYNAAKPSAVLQTARIPKLAVNAAVRNTTSLGRDNRNGRLIELLTGF
jgi:hypothetical protein